jgi:hypothetical protein
MWCPVKSNRIGMMTHRGYPWLYPLHRNAHRFEAWASLHLNARARRRQVIAAMAVDDGLRRDPENIATATARTNDGQNDGHMISGRRPPRFETKNPLLRLRRNQCETVRFDRIKTSNNFISRNHWLYFIRAGDDFSVRLRFSSSQSGILNVRTRDTTNTRERRPPTE